MSSPPLVAPAPGSTEAAPAGSLAAPPSSWKSWLGLSLLDNRHPELHGLRALAIVSVLQYHVTAIYTEEAGIHMPVRWADASMTVFFGMDLFFFLSGFLIGGILLRSLDSSRTLEVGRFYLRRAFRTFPPYFLVLTTLALTTTLTAAQHKNLIYEYLYATNFTSLQRHDVVMFWGWSLALEEQFYLTVPIFLLVLYRLKKNESRAILLALVWVSALVIRFGYVASHPPMNDFELYDQVYFRTKTRFDPLVAGIFLAFVEHAWKEPIGRWLELPKNRAMVAIPTLTCLWLLVNPHLFGEDNSQTLHLFLWGTVTSLFYVGTVLLVLHGDGWLPRVLSAPVFRWVATLGYGVYLVHIPVADHLVVPYAKTLYADHAPMLLLWTGSVAALVLGSLALAYVLHILVEKPCLALRDRLTAR